MPSFCRHNHLIQNCPICSREQHVELRPVVSSSAPRSAQARSEASPRAPGRPRAPVRPASGNRAARPGVRVRRLVRGSDDGYRSPLVPGLKSSDEAQRLAEDIALGATRLEILAQDPPGLYAEIADASADLEERTWLAFLVAYIGPREGEDPFANIEAVRTSWAAGEIPDPEAIEPGPRGAHDAARATRTMDAYRAWAARSGSQAAAIAGEPAWPAPRRFARVFERLALPGFHRDARFELLVSLGALGVYELEAASLALGGDNRVSVGAKRALGIGDPLLLDRRAIELAGACGVALGALDLALYNWECNERALAGLPAGSEADDAVLDGVLQALGL
jgi:hypothetical protein